MANKNPTEISVMKGMTCKLTDDIVFTLAYLVHTEEKNRAASEYYYLGRIDKVSDLMAEAEDIGSDAKKLQKWQWKNLPKYTSTVYDCDDTNARGSRWLKTKIKKAVDWDTFCKLLDGWKEVKKAYNDNAKYPIDDYEVSDGTKIANLKEAKDVLIGLVGKTISHKCVLKSML